MCWNLTSAISRWCPQGDTICLFDLPNHPLIFEEIKRDISIAAALWPVQGRNDEETSEINNLIAG
jgi:hypothetical protein